MKNTLADLNNYLFESLERILDDNITADQLDIEIKRSEAVTSVARTIISNSSLALSAMKQSFRTESARTADTTTDRT